METPNLEDYVMKHKAGKPYGHGKVQMAQQPPQRVVVADTEQPTEVERPVAAEQKSFSPEPVSTAQPDDAMVRTVPGIGLDVGTGFLVGCGLDEEGMPQFRSIRDAFVEIETSVFNPKLFNRNKVRYLRAGDVVYLVGEEAMDFAAISNMEAKRPLADGVVNPREANASIILQHLIEFCVNRFKVEDNELVVFSVPGKQPNNPMFDTGFHAMSIQHMLASAGYRAEPLNEAYAVALSSLGDSASSCALSFSFGAGLVNACFTFRGMSLFEFSVPYSGDYIDRLASQSTGKGQAYIRKLKESQLDLSKTQASRELYALDVAYSQMIGQVIQEVHHAFASSNSINVDAPVPVAIAGGTSMVPGFVDRFAQALEQAKLPFELDSVTHAQDPLRAVAHGCAIWAGMK